MSGKVFGSLPLVVLSVWLSACAPAPAAAPTSAPTAAAAPQSTPTPAPTLEPPMPLRVGFSNYSSNAPIYFALQEGYFADQGLDVELVTFASGNEVYPALATGQIDVAPWALSAVVFNASEQGVNIKFVADKGHADPDACPSDAWVASKEALAAGLTDYSTLKGRKAAVTPGSISEYAMDLMLTQGGVKPDELETTLITDNASKVEALRTGALDLAPMGEPWITFAKAQDAGDIWVPWSQIMPNQSLAFIAFGPSILDKNREAGVRFMTAYLRGVQQVNEGKTDRNVELISAYTKLDPADVRAACWNSFAPDGRVDTDGLLAYQQWLLNKGVLDKQLTLDQFWTDEFITEAAKRLAQ